MATIGALVTKKNNAINRIQEIVSGTSDKPLVLPKRSKYGTDYLIVEQLNAIADYLESNANTPQRYLDAEQLARDGATKAEIVSMLLGE